MTIPSADELALAQASARALWDRDDASRALGIELEEVRPGYARTAMTIVQTMVNGHATAHGGILFTLADSTFALACNSRNVPNVALQCSISFVSAVRLGDRVVAQAQECSLKGRTGVYDVALTRGDETVALFRGVCYRVSGTVIGESATTP
jgi:acyl-CoA thioesterase